MINDKVLFANLRRVEALQIYELIDAGRLDRDLIRFCFDYQEFPKMYSEWNPGLIVMSINCKAEFFNIKLVTELVESQIPMIVLVDAHDPFSFTAKLGKLKVPALLTPVRTEDLAGLLEIFLRK